MRSWAHIAFMYTALFHFITRATNLEVEKLFRDVDHIPKNPKQGYDDAWDLRRLWTFLWRRQKDSYKRGQVPRVARHVSK